MAKAKYLEVAEEIKKRILYPKPLKAGNQICLIDPANAYTEEAIEAVKEARAQGDLSENFEYHAAKKYKNQNESRIRYLERMLKNAEIVSDTSEEGVAGINNRVTVYFPEDDEEETYKLVTSIRGNSIHNYISTESPIGKAIFGHKAGETVKVKVSDDYSYELVIRKIEDTTDDEEDKIRAF